MDSISGLKKEKNALRVLCQLCWEKKLKNVHFLRDCGLSMKKTNILMINAFIELSLNNKTSIISSSK